MEFAMQRIATAASATLAQCARLIFRLLFVATVLIPSSALAADEPVAIDMPEGMLGWQYMDLGQPSRVGYAADAAAPAL